ncbi:MAG: hypothetical protein DHS80DRAFT_31234 [Piptocephalis tieghemiana]|nr:MAG: hypothetical protein DHS80DRAFT_31234 [Piptocephalis tieghemiana]
MTWTFSWAKAWYAIQLPLLFLTGALFVQTSLTLLLPGGFDADDTTTNLQLGYPRSIEDIHSMTQQLTYYVEHHHSRVILAFLLCYTFLQCFGVPGSMLFAVLAGALFPSTLLALLLVLLATSVGASGCYLLSRRYFSAPLAWLFPERLNSWGTQVRSAASGNGGLFGYLVAARVAPTVPNWFINLSSPHLGIPLRLFFPATFLGVAPLAFVCVRAGISLREAGVAQEIQLWTLSNTLLMLGITLMAILPVWVKKNYLTQQPTSSSKQKQG